MPDVNLKQNQPGRSEQFFGATGNLIVTDAAATTVTVARGAGNRLFLAIETDQNVTVTVAERLTTGGPERPIEDGGGAASWLVTAAGFVLIASRYGEQLVIRLSVGGGDPDATVNVALKMSEM